MTAISAKYRFAKDAKGTQKRETASSLEAFLKAWYIRVVS